MNAIEDDMDGPKGTIAASEDVAPNSQTATGSPALSLNRGNEKITVAEEPEKQPEIAEVVQTVDDSAEELHSKRPREQIIWNGPKAESGTDGTLSGPDDKESDPAAKRLRPNPAFLHGFLNGMNRTNKRLIAQAASNAACKELTAVAASGAKVQFDRIAVEEPEKFRNLAVEVARQQNHACCVAVLKEIAAHYGFALEIDTGDSLVKTEAQEGDPMNIAAPDGDDMEEEQPDPRVMQPMYARLRSDLEDLDNHLDHRRRPEPEPEPDKPVQIPALVTNNRLANSALAAITGHGSRKGLANPKGRLKPDGRPVTSAIAQRPVTQLAMDSVTPVVVAAADGVSSLAALEPQTNDNNLAEGFADQASESAEDVSANSLPAIASSPRPLHASGLLRKQVAVEVASKGSPERAKRAMEPAPNVVSEKSQKNGFKSRLFSSMDDPETKGRLGTDETNEATLDIAEERYAFPLEQESAPEPKTNVNKTERAPRRNSNRLFGAAMSGLKR